MGEGESRALTHGCPPARRPARPDRARAVPGGARSAAHRTAHGHVARPDGGSAEPAASAARGRPDPHGGQLWRAHRLRFPGAGVRGTASPLAPRRDDVLPGVCHLQQRRVCDVVRRLRALPLLHAVGDHGRGTLAHRLLVRRHVLARTAADRRPQPGAQHAAAGAGAGRRADRGAGRVVADAGERRLRRRRDVPHGTDPPAPDRAAPAPPTPCTRPIGHLRPRLDDRVSGAVRPAAGRQRSVPRVHGRVSRLTAARPDQPRARWCRRVRGSDGAAPEAVRSLHHAAARLDRVPRGVLPAAVVGRHRGAGGGRTPPAPGAGRSGGGRHRRHDGATHTPAPRPAHVPRRRRAAGVWCNASSGRPPRSSEPRPPGGHHRAFPFRRQHRRGGSPAVVHKGSRAVSMPRTR